MGSGYLTKCCSQDEVLSADLESCVRNPESSLVTSEWLPPRMVLSSATFRPTGHFHIQYSDFPNIYNGSGYQVFNPLQFFTDGHSTVQSQAGEYGVVAYSCMDRTITTAGEITDIALLVCEQSNTISIAKVSQTSVIRLFCCIHLLKLSHFFVALISFLLKYFEKCIY